MDGKVEILDQDDAHLAELVGLDAKDGKSKPITIEKVDSVSVPANAAVASADNEEANDGAKVVKTSFISTCAEKEAQESNASSDVDDIAIVDVAAGEIKLPGAKATTGEVK